MNVQTYLDPINGPYTSPRIATESTTLATLYAAGCDAPRPAACVEHDPCANPRWIAWIEPAGDDFKVGTLCGARLELRADTPAFSTA